MVVVVVVFGLLLILWMGCCCRRRRRRRRPWIYIHVVALWGTVPVFQHPVHGAVNPSEGIRTVPHLLKHVINMHLQDASVGRNLTTGCFGRNVDQMDIQEIIKVGIFLIPVQQLQAVDPLVNSSSPFSNDDDE